jgi:hypothetical protein
MNWIQLARVCPLVGFFEHGNEPSGSLKVGAFPDQLSDCQQLTLREGRVADLNVVETPSISLQYIIWPKPIRNPPIPLFSLKGLEQGFPTFFEWRHT